MSDQGRKLYVGGFSYNYDDDQLRALCEKYGAIEDGMFLPQAFLIL